MDHERTKDKRQEHIRRFFYGQPKRNHRRSSEYDGMILLLIIRTVVVILKIVNLGLMTKLASKKRLQVGLLK